MTKLKPFGPNPLARVLSLFYLFIITLRNLWYDFIPGAVKKTGRYTVSVGCIHAGGTGKTPLVELLGGLLLKKGRDVVFLSRGYKRKSTTPVIVRPGEEKTWEEIGDEPAMLAKAHPKAWIGVGANRLKNAHTLTPRTNKDAVIILDDGFQHRKIFRNNNIVCLPSAPFRDYLSPAGYMREPLQSLNRANIICLIGLQQEAEILRKNHDRISKRFHEASVFILYQTVDHWVNTKTGQISQTCPLKSPVLLSGIARPNRFINITRENGVTPYSYVSYDDHHHFSKEEIEQLSSPESDGIITTEKDIMRLSTINLVNCPNICYLKIKLIFQNTDSEGKFSALIMKN